MLFLAACNGSNSSTPQTDTTADSTFADLAKAKDELATVTVQKSLTQTALDELTRTDPANPGLLEKAQRELAEKNAELAVLKGEGSGSVKERRDALEALKRQAEATQRDIDAKTIELDKLISTDPDNPGLIALKTTELDEKKTALDDLTRIDPVNPGQIPRAQAELNERTTKLAILDGEGNGSIRRRRPDATRHSERATRRSRATRRWN